MIGWIGRTHDTLIITVHHTSQRGKGTGHEDIWVFGHANQSMGLISIVASDNRLTDGALMLASVGEAAETTHGNEKSARLM